jgi:hypothetical protein
LTFIWNFAKFKRVAKFFLDFEAINDLLVSKVFPGAKKRTGDNIAGSDILPSQYPLPLAMRLRSRRFFLSEDTSDAGIKKPADHCGRFFAQRLLHFA